MLRAIVLARVRGWFFMKSRGIERPITRMTRMPVMMWRGSLKRLENIGVFKKSRMVMFDRAVRLCGVAN
jgi:predicted transcriptional regulator